MNNTPILLVDQLSKHYTGADEPALRGVSMTIRKGDIFGLLGPNGAGKTTLISILCGITAPGGGRVEFNGEDLFNNLNKLKQQIGVVPQDIALYPMLTARENLEFYGNMFGVHGRELQQRIADWLERLGLSHAANRRIDRFSGGMKRRINLIASVLHQPQLLFLDEPTVGVDVQSRTVIIEQLKELNQNGMTIIYTSHHLEEAENFCTNIGIIDYGQIIASGAPAALISQTPDSRNLEDVFLHLTKRKLRD